MLAILAVLLLTGCASSPVAPAQVPEAGGDAHGAELAAAPDPWGRFNRGVYRFNARFDEAVHWPVADGYRRVVPQPVRSGVSNFFSNLGELGNTANHLMQLHPGRSLRSAGRFLVNSTVGVLGLVDVATAMGLAHAPTGFALTLGYWGVGPGPYLVLPVLGPSSLRDSVGLLADYGLNRSADIGGLYTGYDALVVGTVNAVDARSSLSFRYYQSGSPFEYELIRFLYAHKRAIETGGRQFWDEKSDRPADEVQDPADEGRSGTGGPP